MRIGKRRQAETDRKLQGKIFDDHGHLFNSGYLFDELEKEVNKCQTAQDMFIATSAQAGLMFSLTRRKNTYVLCVYALLYHYCLSVARVVKLPKKTVQLGEYGFSSSLHYSNNRDTVIMQGDGNTVAFDFKLNNFLEGRDLHVVGYSKKPFKNVISAVKPFKSMKHFYAYTHFNAAQFDIRLQLGDDVDYAIRGTGLAEFARMRTPFRVYRYWAALTAEDGSYGLNLSHGPGKSSINENAFFLNGEGQKLSEAKISVPFSSVGMDYLKPWDITTEKDEVKLKFFPLLDVNNKFSIARSRAEHQVFGRFFGTVKLEDGKLFKIENCFGTIKRYNFKSIGD